MMIDLFDDVGDPGDIADAGDITDPGAIADHNHGDLADHGGFLHRLDRTNWREILHRLESVEEDLEDFEPEVDPEDSEPEKRRPPPPERSIS
jgi:hypothetical protein